MTKGGHHFLTLDEVLAAQSETFKWTPSRKAVIVDAVRDGKLSRAELEKRFGISVLKNSARGAAGSTGTGSPACARQGCNSMKKTVARLSGRGARPAPRRLLPSSVEGRLRAAKYMPRRPPRLAARRAGTRWPCRLFRRCRRGGRFRYQSRSARLDILADACGESGPRARPMDPRWAIDIRNQCVRANVAFFFKQWGGRSPKSRGRLLEGKEWNQFPVIRQRGNGRLQVRAGA
jgi:hypothetical protein